VGDDQRRARAQQIFHRFLDQAFALGVETRRRLIENHQSRVLQKNSGDGDALSLAAGKLYSSLTNPSIEPVGKPLDEFNGVGRFCRCANGLFTRL